MIGRPQRPAPRFECLAAACFAASALGCGDGEGNQSAEAAGPSDSDSDTGSLSVELRTESGLEFARFDYAIVGPGFAKSGGIDVTNGTRVSGLIEGIPPANGYSITLMGASAPPKEADCSGSASFDVTAGEVASADVPVTCHLGVGPVEQPPSVPVPGFATVAIGVLLLAVGALRAPSPSASRCRKKR